MDPRLVRSWAANIAAALSSLDPAGGDEYERGAAAYTEELDGLHREIAARLAGIPPGRRRLVANHQNLGYFARAYGFQVLGALLPTSSTLAEPSAAEIARLVETLTEAGVCAIFTEKSSAGDVAQAVAAELDACPQVQLAALYTDALGPPGSGAATYLEMMRQNAEIIAEALGAPPAPDTDE
jgi:ABC-type Zn uptake system ZnuABC Zn-binding protein ZnuA